MRYVALLRGINVGGKNKLAMKDLAALCESCGCSAVTTYIQSGNVVYDAPKDVGDAIAKAITKKHKLDVPVVVRTEKELAAAAKANPYVQAGVDENELHAMFLADAPSAALIKALDPQRSPGDEYVVKGREIYLRAPNGVGRSKLTTAYFDSKLKTVSTMRNWRTVLKLVEMVAAR